MTVVMLNPGRREKRKEETRKRLLSTAIRLMTEQGFEALTVEAIAIAADVGKGTIYNYFRTKEDIVVAYFVDLERSVQRKLAKWSPEDKSLAGILISFLEFQFRLKRPHYKFVRIFFTQMFARPEQMYPYVVELQAIIDAPLITLFQSLQQRRLLRRDVPMELLVLNFKTMHFGLSAIWALEGPPWKAASAALPAQVHLFCSGLQERR
jgi:AcrR family transcriptional regulator